MTRLAPAGVGEIRIALPLEKLSNYLVNKVPDMTLPLDALQFTHGYSNPTFLLQDAKGKKFVMRRKPPGTLISQTAHNVAREFRVMRALKQYTTIPVPEVYHLCEDVSILGVVFFVMEFVEGRLFMDIELPEIRDRKEKWEIWNSIVTTLANLHAVDFRKCGLGDFASTADFYPRQLKSLKRISEGAQAREGVDKLPGGDYLANLYEKQAPRGEVTIVHGDYKIDNIIFHPTEPRVIGLIDWELATLGHPFSDLCNLLTPWNTATLVGVVPSCATRGLRDLPRSAYDIPSQEELLKLYCSTIGRPYPLKGFTTAVSFAFYRGAIMLQGIIARQVSGQLTQSISGIFNADVVRMTEYAKETLEIGESGNVKL